MQESVGKQVVVVQGVLKVIVLLAQRVGYGQDGGVAQIAFPVQFNYLVALAARIAKGKARHHLLVVFRKSGRPIVQQRFHAHAGGTHAVHQVVVSPKVVLFGVLRSGQEAAAQEDEYQNSFHRISVLIRFALG